MRIAFKLCALTATAAAIACGAPEQTRMSTQAAELELSGVPSVSYDPQTGKTTVVVQFTARGRRMGAPDSFPVPLERSALDVNLRVDGDPLDNESLLKEDSEAMTSNVVYGLVLDASYSMLQHDPPAFEPMKRAAKASIDKAAQLWTNRKGKLTWVVSWFDEFLYTQEGDWRSDDLLTIPAPKQGTATRLYAAVDAMAARLTELRASGVANGPRDRHLMLVFSDGADNMSWFDNPQVSERHVTSSGAGYRKTGAPAVSLEGALERIRSHPRLTVHVLGLGSKVNVDELTSMARAGSGAYFSNPKSSETDKLFERVTSEFGSIHTVGATIPIPPGEHTFELRVAPKAGGESATCRLTFVAGENARISSTCT